MLAIRKYPWNDTYHLTSPQLENLVDFLADAMHWCHVNGHSFTTRLTRLECISPPR